MENLLQTIGDNYIWIIVAVVFVVFTIIGFFVDRSQNKKKKIEIEKEIEKRVEEKTNTPVMTNQEIYTPINIETPTVNNEIEDTSVTPKEFLKEENYELSNLLNESVSEPSIEQNEEVSEPTVGEEPEQQEEQPQTDYDRNLEYLLKEKETPKEEIESIDDFLQRTMREAYQPVKEQEPTVEEEPVQQEEQPTEENQEYSDMDYEDTLPIPIQKEQDFSPLEVTVVDPEFYKEYAVKPELTDESQQEEQQKEIDFKPIEDAILESLEKLSKAEEENKAE